MSSIEYSDTCAVQVGVPGMPKGNVAQWFFDMYSPLKIPEFISKLGCR